MDSNAGLQASLRKQFEAWTSLTPLLSFKYRVLRLTNQYKEDENEACFKKISYGQHLIYELYYFVRLRFNEVRR